MAVIVSTLLIQHYGLLWVDPFCSLLLACLIIVSVLPLIKVARANSLSILTKMHSLQEAASVLLQSTPEGMLDEFEEALAEVLHVEGVTSYSDAHCWELKSDMIVGSLHIQVNHFANILLLNFTFIAGTARGERAANCTARATDSARARSHTSACASRS